MRYHPHMRTRTLLNVALGGALAAGTAPSRAQSPAEGEARWLKNIHQLTREDMDIARAGEAYFAPDGRRICFQGYPKGQDAYQIYVMDVDLSAAAPQTKPPLIVSTGRGATTCSFFAPNNARLLFAANHHDLRPPVAPEFPVPPESKYKWDIFPGMDIFEYSFATGELTRLTDADGYDAEGAYSPDGKRIVFCSMRDGDREIYIMDADGRNPRRITAVKGYDGGPFFAPDGQRIVYRSDRDGSGNMQIFINDLEGRSETPLTGNDVLNWCPFWHPSGKWLIFTRADHGTPENPKRPNYDLYLLAVPPAGEPRARLPEPIRVTFDAGFDGLPVFAPDGRHVMWTSKRSGLTSPQVFIAEFSRLTPAGELTNTPQ